MKLSILSFILTLGLIFINFFLTQSLFAQSKTNGSNPMPEFEPGEVLFLLKDNASLGKVDYPNARMGVSQIDQILQEFAVDNLDILFPDLEDYAGKSLPNLRNAYTGKDIQLANLQRTFKVKLLEKDQFKMYDLIQALNESDEVVYAEPNYIFSNQLTEPSFQPLIRNTHPFSKNESFVPNDPLFSSQEGIQRHQIDQVWQSNRGNEKSVIAVIDTGVDYNHPDLAANIWTNPKESANPNNNDTDGNGFVDDFRGWDFINNDNDPMDDNMHGTHVAGILAAVCDNGIGIAGVNCNAKIMPIKALQSSGRGDASTIAQAILYAANNGATVINMSFGGYAESITMRNALAFAYSKAVLVAAAGNDGRCIGPGIGCAPMFPAAYSFVIGVQENGAGQIGNFSNFDQDGPVFSRYPDLWNYEIKATGISVLSTIPNGQYRALNGTSMAAPYVAGAVSLYMEERPEDSKELLFGNLINSAEGGVLKLFASLNTNPEPRLEFVTFEIDDSEGGDGDGRPDAGENIDFNFLIRNTWGQANNVFIKMELSEFEDETVIEFLNDLVPIGSVSAYAVTKTNEPIRFRINENVIDGRDISLVAKIMIKENDSFTTLSSMSVTITVENMFEFSGPITENTIWSGSVLLTNNVLVTQDAVLTIEPGTKIYSFPNVFLRIDGTLISKGTESKPIEWNARRGQSEYWKGLEFTTLSKGTIYDTTTYNYISGTIIEWNYFNQLRNIVVDNNQMDNGPLFKFNVFNDFNVLGFNDWTVFTPFKIESGLFFGNNFKNLKNGRIGYAGIVNASNSIFLKNSFETSEMPNPNNLNTGPLGPNTIFRFENSEVKKNMFSNNLISQEWAPDGRLGTIELVGLSVFEENVILSNTLRTDSFTANIFIKGAKSFKNNSILNLQTKFQIASSGDFSLDIDNNFFLGKTTREEIGILDFTNDFSFSGLGRISLNKVLDSASENNYPFITSILINGKKVEPSLIPTGEPLGVGNHIFEIVFNKPMNKNTFPNVTMGVREPFNQTLINMNGRWSENGKIFTVEGVIGISTGDGFNTIRISDAIDETGNKIAVEKTNFNVIVDAAGSLSGDFFATPGLGRINLDWASPEEEVSDLLGYNMYRYQYIQVGDTLLPTDTLQINRQLLNQEHFEDLEVIPGEQYFYGYKIVRTNLTESDFSKIISAVALTAEKGDVNGDLKVDVLDVVSTISHIIGENPRPFIDEAADINEDGTINVLDVVQIISKILNPSSASTEFGSLNLAKATLLVDEEGMVLDSNEPIAGLQLEVKNWKKGTPYTVHEAFRQFESIQYETDSSLVLLLFNFGGNVIPGGKIPLLSFEGAMPEVFAITTAGERGKPILTTVNYRSPEQQRPEHFQVFQNSPNPFSQSTTIHYTISAPSDVTLFVYSIMGETLITETQSHQSAGKYSFEVQANGMKRGIYLYRVLVKGADGVQMSSAKKMMYIP